MSKKNKKNKWVKKRHTIIKNIVYLFFSFITKLKYRAKITKFKGDRKKQYLILMNHQTAYDQFFVSLAFPMHVYYLASEDLFSKGFLSSLLCWAVAPIPIKKQVTDVRAVMNCLTVVKEGGTIALAPEGNRTYSGKTEHINPAIGGLIRALKLPVVFFKIEGGYGVQPRWSNVVRRGKMRAYPSKVLEYDDYKHLSNEQIAKIVSEELYVNEATLSGEFYHKKNAEYLERVIYVCPKCGLSEFASKKDNLTCKKCGFSVRYLPNKTFEGISEKCPYTFVNDWYEYQNNFINSLNLTNYLNNFIYEERVKLFEVKVYKSKKLLTKNALIKLYGDRIEFSGEINEVYKFDSLSAITVLGKNKLNIYLEDGKLYQIKGENAFNALKYVQIFYRYKNLKKGDENVKFLGL